MMNGSLLIVLGLLVLYSKQLERNPEALSKVNQPLYAGLSEECSALENINAGQSVRILAVNNEWAKIKKGNVMGWVPFKNLLEV